MPDAHRVDEDVEEQRRCLAHAVSTGEQCRRYAEPGSAYCKIPSHGGGGRSHRAAAVRRLAGRFYDPDAPPVTDPVGELAHLAGMYRYALDVVGHQVNELASYRTTTVEGSEQVRAEVQLWQQLAREYQRSLTELSRAGLDQQRAEIEDKYFELVAATVKALLSDLGLSGDQWVKVGQVAPRHFQQLGQHIEAWDADGQQFVASLAPSDRLAQAGGDSGTEAAPAGQQTPDPP